jgi:hypothetical protein
MPRVILRVLEELDRFGVPTHLAEQLDESLNKFRPPDTGIFRTTAQ